MMNPKSILTIVLSVFVVIGFGVLIANEMKAKPDAAAPEETSAFVADADAPSLQLIVTYFHGQARCMTCRTIEAYAKEAVETNFPAEMQEKRMVWRTINVHAPENQHYVMDYQLRTQSVVLSLIHNGEEIEWKNLEAVWMLVGDKDRYFDYVKDEAGRLLEMTHG